MCRLLHLAFFLCLCKYFCVYVLRIMRCISTHFTVLATFFSLSPLYPHTDILREKSYVFYKEINSIGNIITNSLPSYTVVVRLPWQCLYQTIKHTFTLQFYCTHRLVWRFKACIRTFGFRTLNKFVCILEN